MPFTEMVVSIATVAALALVFIHVVRLIATTVAHRTVRRVSERDPAAAAPLIERLTKEPEERTDDRTAVLLIAFGAALTAASVIAGDEGWMRYGIAGAAFPLFMGAALWLRHMAVERRRRTARAPAE